MDGLLIVLLLGLVVAGPWLIGKIWASTARNTVHKTRNQRAQELAELVVRFEVPDVEPRTVVDAIVDEAGFATKKSVKESVYITDWDDGHVRFELTSKINLAQSGFTAILEVADDEDVGGTAGQYQIVDAYQIDGRAAGVEEMEQIETTIRRFIPWRFPETRILT